MSSSMRAKSPGTFDRRSQAQSYYGHPTSGSMGGETPILEPSRDRKDSSSTFFGRNVEESEDTYRNSSYHRPSYQTQASRAEPAQEEEAGWDVYADFNNRGPRYSTAPFAAQTNDGYRKLARPQSPSSKADEMTPVELVTVPAFGPEWKQEELRDMTKRGKKEKKSESRRQMWQAWRRDQHGFFGSKWLTRKTLVWFLFGLCIIVAIVLAITIPRVPSFSFNAGKPLAASGGTPQFQRAPEANFTFNAKLELQIETGSNVIPLHFNNLNAKIYDLNTFQQVAEGDLGAFVVPAHAFYPIEIPVVFDYVAGNDSDITWNDWYDACRNRTQDPDGIRPGVNIKVVIEMDIRGLLKKAGASTQISNAPCPIELPSTIS